MYCCRSRLIAISFASTLALAVMAADFASVSSASNLAVRVDAQMVDPLSIVYPPGSNFHFRADLGFLVFDPATFDATNLLAVPTAFGAATLFPVSVSETNGTTGRERQWSAGSGIVWTTLPPAGYDTTSAVESVFGACPPWEDLATYVADRDPWRQTVTLTLVGTDNVDAVEAVLSNALAAVQGGGNTNFPWTTNDLAFISLAAAADGSSGYAFVPTNVPLFDLFGTTNLVAEPLGGWYLRGQQTRSGNPMAFTLGGVDLTFLALGSMVDTDQDGLTDARERLLTGSSPELADTDGDGLDDGSEFLRFLTSAKDADTDLDGVPDSIEIAAGCSNPRQGDTFTRFQLARLLGLPPVRVTVTSEFASIYLNAQTAGASGHLLESGLVPAHATNRAPCSVGASAEYGNGYAQYTALASGGSADDIGTLTVFMDHYVEVPGQAVSGIDVSVSFEGGRIVSAGDWEVDHDCAENEAATTESSARGDTVHWSCDFGYVAEYPEHTFGGYGWRTITYEPILPMLEIAPTAAYRAVEGAAVDYTASVVSNAMTYGGEIWWTVEPRVAGGPVFEGASNSPIYRAGATARLLPGATPGVYTVRAAPNGITALGGAATVTVIRVESVDVHSSDTNTHRIASNLGTHTNHFVCVKDTGGIILDAAVTPTEAADTITWEVDGDATTITSPAVGSDRTTATLPSASSQKIPVRIKVGGDACWSGTVWTAWVNLVATTNGTSSIDGRTLGSCSARLAARYRATVGIDWKGTIQPPAIVTDHDRPAIDSQPRQAPPGDNYGVPDKWNPDASGSGFSGWDVSRQKTIRAHYGSGLTNSAVGDPFPWYPQNYPALDTEGNDDADGTDEDSDPYTAGKGAVGEVIGTDQPEINYADALNSLQNDLGYNGDKMHHKVWFREFARVQLGTKWYRCSDFSPWRFFYELERQAGQWNQEPDTTQTFDLTNDSLP